MRTLLLAAVVTLFSANAFAASCEEKSAEKKLAGAAKTSFMKKCEADAKGEAKPEAKAEPKKADVRK